MTSARLTMAFEALARGRNEPVPLLVGGLIFSLGKAGRSKPRPYKDATHFGLRGGLLEARFAVETAVAISRRKSSKSRLWRIGPSVARLPRDAGSPGVELRHYFRPPCAFRLRGVWAIASRGSASRGGRRVCVLLRRAGLHFRRSR